MEIIVGRNVTGDNTFKVDNTFVSGKHCKVWYDNDEGVVFVEDLNSTNGTYVEGALVKRKRIGLEDKILLGGPGGFETTAKELFQGLTADGGRDKVEEGRELAIDGHSIEYLRSIYEDYQKKMASLKSRAQMFQMLRIIPTSLIGIGLAALGLSKQSWIGVGAMAVALVVCFVLTSILVRKNDAKINTLKELHQIKYSCPNRHRYYGDRSWKVLEHEEECQFCREKFH